MINGTLLCTLTHIKTRSIILHYICNSPLFDGRFCYMSSDWGNIFEAESCSSPPSSPIVAYVLHSSPPFLPNPGLSLPHLLFTSTVTYTQPLLSIMYHRVLQYRLVSSLQGAKRGKNESWSMGWEGRFSRRFPSYSSRDYFPSPQVWHLIPILWAALGECHFPSLWVPTDN